MGHALIPTCNEHVENIIRILQRVAQVTNPSIFIQIPDTSKGRDFSECFTFLHSSKRREKSSLRMTVTSRWIFLHPVNLIIFEKLRGPP